MLQNYRLTSCKEQLRLKLNFSLHFRFPLFFLYSSVNHITLASANTVPGTSISIGLSSSRSSLYVPLHI